MDFFIRLSDEKNANVEGNLAEEQAYLWWIQGIKLLSEKTAPGGEYRGPRSGTTTSTGPTFLMA